MIVKSKIMEPFLNFTNLKLFVSPFTDPFLNLAIENQLLREVLPNEKFVFFYTNLNCVVMGRFQNPWVECKVGKMMNDKIMLVRRQSGGGTVYHDSGNLNFSFIQSSRDHLKDHNNEIIINALKDFGIHAYASGRSDLMLVHNEQNFKFSGSAFKQKKDRSFHHGTLLIDANLENLNDYLHAKAKSIEAKGIKSVRSNVINLTQLNNKISKEALIESISKSFKNFYGVNEIERHDVLKYESQIEVQEYLNTLKDWSWLYGETPSFNINVDISYGQCHLKVNKGIITACEFNEHSVHPSLLEVVENKMVGVKFTSITLEQLFFEFICDYSMFETELTQMLEAIKLQVEI